MPTPEQLRDLARRCRRLAQEILEEKFRQRLLDIAEEFERDAAALEQQREGNDNHSKCC